MADTVYVVTDGDYSDYHICAVFDSKSKADDYCNQMAVFDGYSNPRVEEYTVNIAKDIPAGMYPVLVSFCKNDDTICTRLATNYDLADGKERVKYYGTNKNRWCNMLIFARSVEHAVKIGSEKRREVIAVGEWSK